MKGSSLTNEKMNESIHRKWLITEKNGHKKLRNEIFEKTFAVNVISSII